MNRIIFLDVDGVLNDHTFDEKAKSCTISRQAMWLLNDLIRRSGAEIVLCSAWRYMITGGAMTTAGFKYMLQTHGLNHAAKIIGFTLPDEFCAACERHNLPPAGWDYQGRLKCKWCGKENTRAMQVMRWLSDNKVVPDPAFVILDDLDLGYTEKGLPFVQTDGKVGLTGPDVEDALLHLGVR